MMYMHTTYITMNRSTAEILVQRFGSPIVELTAICGDFFPQSWLHECCDWLTRSDLRFCKFDISDAAAGFDARVVPVASIRLSEWLGVLHLSYLFSALRLRA